MSHEDIQVVFDQKQGKIKSIHGANIGPLCGDGGYDLSEYHSQIAFPTIRLHDCPYYYREVVDIPCIFPLFHLDETDPANYKFARTDAYIQSILDCGSKIVYRLGVSIQGHPKYKFDTEPPANYTKWANICANIIRHYNEGWADGFHHNIQYWEIWNEPDDGHGQWEGTFEQFIDFYVTVARIIKEKCPNVKVGGPALNGAMQNVDKKMHHVGPFLEKVKATNSPLDFFSWHSYPDFPGHVTVPAKKIRKILDDFGFPETESHLNEWNIAPFMNVWGISRDPHTRKLWIDRTKGMEGASLAAATLIAMQDVPVDMANFYDASNGILGMFHFNGVPAKSFFAFKMFKTMIANAPCRVEVVGSDPDNGLAILAGESEDASRRMILLANYRKPQGLWNINLKGLGQEKRELRVHVVDAYNNYTLERTESIQGPVTRLAINVPPRTIRLVELECQSG